MRRLTKKQIERIHLLAARGFSEREIAKKMDCSRSAVWYWLQR